MKIRFMLPVLAVAALGCGGDATPSTPVAKPVIHKPAPKPVTPAESETELSGPKYVYAYNPVGKRDPFRSPLDEQQHNPNQVSACSEPLCQWDLDQLKLVAVITGMANPAAMVEDPKGIGYVIHRNTRMGKLGGKVTQILRDSVIVTEFFVTPDGKSNPNPRTLALEKDKQTVGDLDLISGRYIQ